MHGCSRETTGPSFRIENGVTQKDKSNAVVGLIRQMERHTRDQAYFLFLYNPVQLYAVNKAVEFVPYVTTTFNLVETSVTAQHWSVRKQKATGPE